MTQAANLGALGTNAGTTGILPAAGGGTGTSAGVTGFKNRIINGAMVIDQRNAGASVTPTNGQYVLDRFQYNLSQTSKITTQQSSTTPAGFTKSLLATSSSAYSVTSTDYFTITQPIEGFNVADLGWGTANAKTVTLSAWVYSSLTGTFGGSILNGSFNYAYPFSYTISSANTWTQISVTIAGPTAGTWTTDNSSSVQVNFSLGAGSTRSGTAGAWSGSFLMSATGATSVVGTNGATFYITGCQLEVGSTATSFDYRPYGTELQLCQRYFYNLTGNATNTIPIIMGQAYSTSAVIGSWIAPVPMRTTPTLSGNSLNSITASGNNSSATTWTIDVGSTNQVLRINATGASTLVAGNASSMTMVGSASYFNLSAEL